MAGIEPALDFDATGIPPCGCVIWEQCRAANALHSGRPEWLEMALDDTDLQRVVEAWADLPESMRKAIAFLVTNLPGGTRTHTPFWRNA